MTEKTVERRHHGSGHELAEELAEANARFETVEASEVIDWAFERFGKSLLLACSFQDIVLVDLAVTVEPNIEVVFLDTDAHFPETLAFVESIRQRYDLNLTVTHPRPEASAWPCGTEQCCQFRKVAPLREALVGHSAWMTALKRVDAVTRTFTPTVAYDEGFSMVKINPLVRWSDEDIDAYLADNDLPVHPLISKGYLSIGCAPTTRPVADGADPRSGRWAGTDKLECGLHS